MNENRFLKLQKLFDNQKYFKMICGAGNEDLEEVKRLTMIYTLAGAKGLDISATPVVVESCMEGIDRAFDLSIKINQMWKMFSLLLLLVLILFGIKKVYMQLKTILKKNLMTS